MRTEVLVGLDHSPAAIAALLWAARYADRTGRPLRAVHVQSWPDGVAIESPAPGWIEGLALSQDRLLAGSVAHYCLSHAACPVAALPAAPPRKLEAAPEDLAQVLAP